MTFSTFKWTAVLIDKSTSVEYDILRGNKSLTVAALSKCKVVYDFYDLYWLFNMLKVSNQVICMDPSVSTLIYSCWCTL